MSAIEFAGHLSFRDHWENRLERRIVLALQVQTLKNELMLMDFLVDTGSQWGVLPYEVGDIIQCERTGERPEHPTILCGHQIRGEYCRVPLVFHSGLPGHLELRIEATVLLADKDDDWPGPNVLGLEALGRLTWALEPHRNRFHYLVAG